MVGSAATTVPTFTGVSLHLGLNLSLRCVYSYVETVGLAGKTKRVRVFVIRLQVIYWNIVLVLEFLCICSLTHVLLIMYYDNIWHAIFKSGF